MNNTNENKTSDIYLAHVDFETGRTQSFQEHTDNVTSYAKSICPMEEIQKLVEAAALFHDAGKLSDDVQKDFQDILKKGDQAHRNDLDHSTAGGRMLWKMMRQKTAAELLSTVVYSHHGISDCIDFESGCTLQERRAEKECQEDIVKERFFSDL
ncbi:MAG: CRISPR-associated endonuclease Cas3'' [Blautia sp.]